MYVIPILGLEQCQNDNKLPRRGDSWLVLCITYFYITVIVNGPG
jgi:hypothetical protein